MPIAMDGRPILLIGKGDQPQVWLWGLANKETKELVEVVSSNSVRIVSAPIKVESENDSTCVKLNDKIIVKAVKLSDEKAMVEQIDMRPLGFNIHGDSNTLNVGTTVMVGNQMIGGQAFIALCL